MSSKNWKILGTLAVVIGGIAFIAFQSMGDVEYYVHVEKVHENPEKWVGQKNLQVHGFVVAGSIKKEIVGQTTRRTFQVESKGKVIDVVHTGVAPDTFKDQSEAVVKGEVKQENGKLVMYALPGEPGIMAKCPSKYDGKR